jgi:hypothetical protein
MHSINVKPFILFFLCAFIACNETIDDRHKILEGTWYLQKAKANGSETDRLDGTKYVFQHNNLKTNLPQIGDGNYTLDKDKLSQKGEQTIHYKISELSEKRLVLLMTLRDIDFLMEFGRDSLITE